jgi:hypothetical protein
MVDATDGAVTWLLLSTSKYFPRLSLALPVSYFRVFLHLTNDAERTAQDR